MTVAPIRCKIREREIAYATHTAGICQQVEASRVRLCHVWLAG
jgi:hypothetical protein